MGPLDTADVAAGGAPVRVLHLSGAEPEPWAVTFHPRLTVVGGLSPSATSGARSLLTRLAAGEVKVEDVRGGRCSGRVTIGDEEVDLADAVAAGALVDLSVPPSKGPDGPRPEEGPRALDAQLGSAEESVRLAEAAVDAVARDWATEAAAGAELQRRSWSVRAAASLALRRAASGRAAVEADDRAARGPDEPGDAMPPVLATTNGHGRSEDERHRWDLVARRAVLDAELADLSVESVHGVRAALDALDRYRPVDVDEANRLAESWEAARRRRDRRVPGADPGRGSAMEAAQQRIRAAEARVAASRRAVADIEGRAGSPDTAELEAAHAEVLLAWEASEHRVGVGRALRRLEEAQQLEQALLERLGFATYTEFMVSGRASANRNDVRLAAAGDDLARAEQELADAVALAASADPTPVATAPAAGEDPRTGSDPASDRDGGHRSAEPARAAPEDEALEDLQRRAAELLGHDPGGDVAAGIRAHVASDPLPRLRMALTEAGVDVPSTVDRAHLAALAGSWLDEARDGADRRSEIERETSEIGSRLSASREGATGADATGFGPPEVQVARRSAVAAAVADEREARAALEVAVAALVAAPGDDGAGASLVERRARAEARLAMARLEVTALRGARHRRVADAAVDGEPMASVDAATWDVLARLASHHARRGAGRVGPITFEDPTVELAADEAIEVLRALSGPATLGQVLVFSDRPEVRAWAAGLPIEAGGVAVERSGGGGSLDGGRSDERAAGDVPTIGPVDDEEVL